MEGVMLRLGIPARIFATMLRLLPGRVGDRMWRWWYQRLAKRDAWGTLDFMNYGFVDDTSLILTEEDEKSRLFIQLYNMNIRELDISGKQVLEVGSGRGGGASWIARTYKPNMLTAIDYSPQAAKMCSRKFSDITNLNFSEGNAMKMTFEDNTFDVIYNVESSHCYSNMDSFGKEVFRVLKPGGKFAWTDFRDKKGLKNTQEAFLSTGLISIKDEEITKQVITALDQINEEKQAMIQKGTGKFIRRSFETFAGVKGTPVYEAFQNGTLGYYRAIFQKPEL
ncbi:MAG: methyltransferase type 11 [Euryarchaeota archaeon]|nr:methyltransferase type 11 [Euryarchaeota archaeon]|tara:strand:- start:10556 stop:11395 length:840 start_codon:yes stop_codon:yes gene_type:complete